MNSTDIKKTKLCQGLLRDEAVNARYPDICFLLCAALVFMLSNASCERGFSMQNHIKGI